MSSHEVPGRRPRPGRRPAPALLSVSLAVSLGLGTLVASGCGPFGGSGGGGSGCIRNEQGDACLPVAPESERVDLAKPLFSNPTQITNPLFPVKSAQVLQLGTVDGKPFRAEATLLPGAKTINWDGRQIPTLISQYVAYLDGRIHEVAIDWYAQADDGSVWYFGEDVFNYADGVVADTDGTWLAGKDGPPGMIMPANPQVGDVYRPENIPGVVFEEVTVTATGQTLAGPRGQVGGAIVVKELHMDGKFEEKSFAPGYGEFSTGSGTDREAVAIVVPVDAVSGPLPAQIVTVSTGAGKVFDAAGTKDWTGASAAVVMVREAWDAYRAGGVPDLLGKRMGEAVDGLDRAVAARNPDKARQAAIDVGHASLDLRLRHQQVAQIDILRLGLWARQIVVDTAAKDVAAVAGDVATVETVWARVGHTVDKSHAARLDTHIRDLRAAANRKDVTTAAKIAPAFLETLSAIPPA